MYDIDTAKSYATESNLQKGLEKLGFAQDRHFVVCNRQGRFTAIFPASNITGRNGGGYLALYASRGFLTVG